MKLRHADATLHSCDCSFVPHVVNRFQPPEPRTATISNVKGLRYTLGFSPSWAKIKAIL